MKKSELFNTLSNSENMVLLKVTTKKAEIFNKFALDFISENPVMLKSYLLACEYNFQYEETKSAIEKLQSRNTSLENQLKTWKRSNDAVICGKWTLTKKVNGVEKTFTYEELESMTVKALNDNDIKITNLQVRKDSLANILNTSGMNELIETKVNDAERITCQLLRYSLLNSKCLDIKNCFTELAKACQEYNREKLKGQTTKETYMNMKKGFKDLCDMVKVTKDTKASLMKVHTSNFNSEEMDILANTLFSSATIGVFTESGTDKAYYTLSAEKKPVILDNIVKIVIMKLQGVKITLENI